MTFLLLKMITIKEHHLSLMVINVLFHFETKTALKTFLSCKFRTINKYLDLSWGASPLDGKTPRGPEPGWM